MINRALTGAAGLLLAAGIVTASPPPAHAAQTAPAAPQTCEQMSAEIQALSAEIQGFAGTMQTNMAEQQRLMQRQMAASTLAGAIPVPFVGIATGQAAHAAGAADRQRAAEVQRSTMAASQDYMARMPAIAARMEVLGVRYDRECLNGAGAAAMRGE